MPIRDYDCKLCGKATLDLLVMGTDTPCCQHCGSDQLDQKLVAIGGYHINGNNSASQRPKNAGSFKKGAK